MSQTVPMSDNKSSLQPGQRVSRIWHNPEDFAGLHDFDTAPEPARPNPVSAPLLTALFLRVLAVEFRVVQLLLLMRDNSSCVRLPTPTLSHAQCVRSINWLKGWAIPGLGMFMESYMIFSTGQIKTIWHSAYPTCWLPKKGEPGCPNQVG